MSLLKDMLEAGVHFGHQTKYWNPKMKPFIYGAKSKIHIINLDKTVRMFEDALKFVNQTVKNGGEVLFVGTRSQASDIIIEEATRAGMPYVAKRWLGGLMTNFETVKKSMQKLKDKSEILSQNDESGFSKKELLNMTREVAKLNSSIGGISEMKKLPSALFVVDTGCHDLAIKEANKLGIPVIGIVDTNNDPSGIDFVVPGNDDASKAIKLYTSLITDAILKAKESSLIELTNQVKVEMVDADEEGKQKRVRRIKKAEADDELATESVSNEADAIS